MQGPFQFVALVAVALLFYAAWRDVATRTIPDEISIAIAVIGLGTRLADGWESALLSLGVATLVFIILLVVAMRGLLGGADVKLTAALSLGLPPAAAWDFIFISVLLGGVLGMIYLATMRRDPAARISLPAAPHEPLFRRVAVAEARRLRRGGPLPYAVAIALGGSFTLLVTAGS